MHNTSFIVLTHFDTGALSENLLIISLLTHIKSTFAVASSITSILFLLSNALAKHISCRCPTLKLEPPSDTSASNLLSNFRTTSLSCTYKHMAMLH